MQLQAPVEGTGTAVLEELLLHCALKFLQSAEVHPAPTSEEARLPHVRHRRRFGDCGVLGSAAVQVAGSVLFVVPGVARATGSPGRTDLAHRTKQCSLLRRRDVRFQANRKVLFRDVHPKRRCCCFGCRAIGHRARNQRRRRRLTDHQQEVCGQLRPMQAPHCDLLTHLHEWGDQDRAACKNLCVRLAMWRRTL